MPKRDPISIRNLKFDFPPEDIVCLAVQLRPDIQKSITVDRIVAANKSGYCWAIAVKNSETVGLLGYHRIETIASGGALYIHDLVVEDILRGQGIGTLLMNYAIELSKSTNCASIQLDTSFPRKRARRFYERFGFEKTGYFLELQIANAT